MKKSIVALAVLSAVSGAAMAQSSVTLYGIVDVGYQWNEAPTQVGTTTVQTPSGPLVLPVIRKESWNAINGGYQSGNRWGLRGSEDLGGGWRAIFTLESGFSIDTGAMGNADATNAQGTASAATASGRLFGRQAFAGFQSGLGTAVAGRLATFSSGTGSFDMFGRVDPFSAGFGQAGLQNTFISVTGLRADNAIAYQSPKFAGFQGGVGYSTNINGAEVAPNGNNVQAFFAGLNWEAGPFYAVVTYDSIDPGNLFPQKDTQKHLQVGGTFAIAGFTINAAFAQQDNIASIAAQPGITNGNFFDLRSTAIPQYDSSAYMIGGTWTLGAWKFMASYQWSDADGQNVNVPGRGIVNFDPDYDVYGVGATYNLSRRTNLYIGYGHRSADGTLAGSGFDASQFALGFRHLF